MARGQDDPRRDAGRGGARRDASSSSSSRSTPPRRLRRRAEVSAAERAVVPAARIRAHRQRRRRAPWSCRRCGRWRSAACAITSAAAFIAIRWTATGGCRTSRRCSTTRRRSCSPVSRRRRPARIRSSRRLRRTRCSMSRRDMTDARGGFYSAEDADSHAARAQASSSSPQALRTKVEGAFYVWTADEIAHAARRRQRRRSAPLRRPAERQRAVRSATRVRQQESALHGAVDRRHRQGSSTQNADRSGGIAACDRARSCSTSASCGRAACWTTRC